MAIPAGAKKCPYCHHWQYRLSQIVLNPLFGLVIVLVVFLPMVAFYCVMMDRILSKGEPFRDYAQQITIVESKMEFGKEEDEQGRSIVAVVGRIKNASPIDWKELHLQVDFLDSKGELIDAGQESWCSPFLPANDEVAFKVSFTRQFPESQYAQHKIRVAYAVENRALFP